MDKSNDSFDLKEFLLGDPEDAAADILEIDVDDESIDPLQYFDDFLNSESPASSPTPATQTSDQLLTSPATQTSNQELTYTKAGENEPIPSLPQGEEAYAVTAFDIDAKTNNDSFQIDGDDLINNLMNDLPSLDISCLNNYPVGSADDHPASETADDPNLNKDSDIQSQQFSTSLLNWVMQQPDPACHLCTVLRKTVHSSGLQDTKLEIHFREGQGFHSVLQVRNCCVNPDGNCNTVAPQKMQIPGANAEYMKQFLIQYSLLRAKEGFALRHDCTLVTSRAGSGYSSVSDPWFPGPMNSHAIDKTDFPAGQSYFGKPNLNMWTAFNNSSSSSNPNKAQKSYVAAQRERTGKMQLSDCAKYFHLPITEAAKRLSVCPTVLKKVCRRNGLPRWPHRKIKSLERTISNLEETLAGGDGQDAQNLLDEIACLKKEKDLLCSGIYVTTQYQKPQNPSDS